MNELQSVQKTKVVWSFLRDNPKSSKHEAYIKLGLTEDIADCALCEYTRCDCEICPLKSFWLETATDDVALSHLYIACPYQCQYEGTPYSKWSLIDFDDGAKSACANQIVEACDAKIASILAARGFLSKIYNRILARFSKKQ